DSRRADGEDRVRSLIAGNRRRGAVVGRADAISHCRPGRIRRGYGDIWRAVDYGRGRVSDGDALALERFVAAVVHRFPGAGQSVFAGARAIGAGLPKVSDYWAGITVVGGASGAHSRNSIAFHIGYIGGDRQHRGGRVSHRDALAL